jgi:DNA primase small subunit
MKRPTFPVRNRRRNPEVPIVQDFLKKLFQAYYREANVDSLLPSDLPKREMAFILFDKKGMVRHKGFLNGKDYKAFLVSNVPQHLYYSATLYHSPWKERIDEKGYIGCDLIFDIDCDHIDTPCKADHDTWKCLSCEQAGAGKAPATCPACGGSKFDEKGWLCDTCLEKSKTETRKLIDGFLTTDFHIDQDKLGIYFSGQRGYHVHVEQDAFQGLSAEARREIADYITGTGLSVRFSAKGQTITGFSTKDPGWRGKIAAALSNVLDALDDPATRAGLGTPFIKQLAANKRTLKKRLDACDPNWMVPGIGFAGWNKIIEFLVASARCEIDVPVTIDIHRLIRSPGSLHGKSGFKICKLRRDQLDRFDPFTDSVVFKGGEQKVKMIDDVPLFRIEDNALGPYAKDDVETMSLGAAVYLLCKNKAILA